ncbi:MAG: peptide chain release factor N(5)-glutamine methyltransferase, partial [Clostridia bacterium]|nr:peptide chain release factor N(5)-glutamine methyltransferase [Clostridia bacterium]
MTVSEATRLMSLRLAKIDADAGAQEARILMAHVLAIEVGALPLHRQMELTAEQLATLTALTARRESREPLQYILGEWSFLGLPVSVDENVLIPRPETELLCEYAIFLAKERNYCTALDLCTGSGCIAVALAANTAMAVTASDISMGSVLTAQENARRNSVSLSVRQSDLFASIVGTFDLIVCNPPYLSDRD